MRRFHSYGPVDPELHFSVPRTALVEACVAELLGGADQDKGGHYFTLWGPRQTGKTWIMHRAIEELRARHGERFLVATLSMQGVELADDDPDDRFFRLVPSLVDRGLGRWLGLTAAPLTDWMDWGALFRRGSSPLGRPVILLIDEFDRLPPRFIDALVAQFRDLYLDRDRSLLHGLALVGVRAVLGVDSPRGSPFNVQRSLRIPNLTAPEVTAMFRQYQDESGQAVDPEVVAQVYEATRGQPGLVGWLGELLTEKYNRDPQSPITLARWQSVYSAACHVEPNNTVLNLLAKARREPYRKHVTELFAHANVPFSFDEPWCNHLYANGVIDYEEATSPLGEPAVVCRFSCPFLQHRLYNAFRADVDEMDLDLRRPVPVVDPRDDLTEVFEALDLPALVERYRGYLARLKQRGINPWKGQPRRADLHLTEAVGHFHLYWWLVEATRQHLVVSPEFPTGNGKVDLHVRNRDRAGVLEVKSFTQRSDLASQREQAARYAAGRGLGRATLVVFVPTDDEELIRELSGEVVIGGVVVTTAAIAAA